MGHNGCMASKGKPSPRSAVTPLADEQVAKLAAAHHLVDPTRILPDGPRTENAEEINAQNPRVTARLLRAVGAVVREQSHTHAWGLDHIPETGVFITVATHVTMFDSFIPMMAIFNQGRRPRFMAKAELAHWPIIGRWLRLVGMQPVPRRSGKARQIEEESLRIIMGGRPLTIWPEGTLTRDPQKWPMSLKNGAGIIALEASRRLGSQVPLFCAVTWGAGSINHWWPWPRKHVVLCYDAALDYSDLLRDAASWGDEPPRGSVAELTTRIHRRMSEVMATIRGEEVPDTYLDYRSMTRKPWSQPPLPERSSEELHAGGAIA